MKTCAVGRFRSSSKRRRRTSNYAKLRRATRVPKSAIQQAQPVVKSDPLFLSKSLGVERECNRENKVAYVLHFRASTSLGVESGDNRFCVLAYLTALLGGHFPILQYLTWFLRGRFFYFSLFCSGGQELGYLRGCRFQVN